PRERHERGLLNGPQEYVAIRERWATLTNQALRDAHIDARVDHRSLQAQGIDREPRPYIPFAAFQMEKQGLRSEVAERLREQYASRVQARVAEGARPEAASEVTAGPPPQANTAQPDAPPDLDEIRRQALENWQKMRAGPSQPAGRQPSDRSTDDEHSP